MPSVSEQIRAIAYTCVCKHSFTASFYCYFNTVPLPVERLQASNVSSNAIECTWDPPTHSNGPITNYFLYWSSEGVSPASLMAIPPDVHRCVLHSLSPYTAYHITVCVANTAGKSKNRSLIVHTTEAGNFCSEHWQLQ